MHRLTAFIMVLLVAMIGCSDGEQRTGRSGDDRDDATGALVIYAAGPRALAEAFAAAFTEQTGIATSLFSATSGQIMARLEAERFRPRADVIILASAPAADWLAEQGRLRSLSIDEAGVSVWDDPRGFWLASSAAAVGLAVRAEFMDESLSWRDVLDGPLAERATMPGPSRSGSAADFVLAITAHEGDEAWRLFRAARSRGMDIAAANSQAMTNLLIGANDVIVGAVDYLVFREIERGEAVRMHFPPEGSAVVPRPIAVLASTPRPRKAEAFVSFVRSDEAQKLAAQRHLLPAFPHIPRSPQRGPDDPVALPSPSLDADAQRAILRRFQYDIERAVIPPRVSSS